MVKAAVKASLSFVFGVCALFYSRWNEKKKQHCARNHAKKGFKQREKLQQEANPWHIQTHQHTYNNIQTLIAHHTTPVPIKNCKRCKRSLNRRKYRPAAVVGVFRAASPSWTAYRGVLAYHFVKRFGWNKCCKCDWKGKTKAVQSHKISHYIRFRKLIVVQPKAYKKIK